jgi:hypothetical protein
MSCVLPSPCNPFVISLINPFKKFDIDGVKHEPPRYDMKGRVMPTKTAMKIAMAQTHRETAKVPEWWT